MRRRMLFAAFAGLAVVLSGCGSDHVPTYPVSGRLTINGKPPSTEGWVAVLHLEPPPTSTSPKDYPHPLPRAKVEVDGSFRFHTYETNDGAPAGTYKISFINMASAEIASNKQGPDTEDEDEKLNKNTLANNKAKDEKSQQVYWPTPIEIRPESNELPPFDIKTK